jgi:ribonucleoside-diphosphate reductase alpha chain
MGILLQTSSGIHPHHSNKYFRRIQCNKHDPVFQYFKKHNPHAVEESVWSANKTDEVITFPIYVNGETIVKKDLTALQHMEIIKKVYNSWVKPGTTVYNKKPITHNISCTVLVKDSEWKDVSKYLFENRASFTAMSFLPALGDKIYKQAPFEDVVTVEDEEKYNMLIEKYKHVDYTKLKELEDTTTVADTLACAGGACQL